VQSDRFITNKISVSVTRIPTIYWVSWFRACKMDRAYAVQTGRRL